MAKSFLKLIILGNLGQTPELRRTGNGTPVINLSVATNHGYKNSDGDYVESTEWHNVVAFGRQAENCAKYLRKGSKVMVESEEIRQRPWKDRDGNERYAFDVIAEKIQFMDPKGSGERGGQQPAQNRRPAKGKQQRPRSQDRPVAAEAGYSAEELDGERPY